MATDATLYCRYKIFHERNSCPSPACARKPQLACQFLAPEDLEAVHMLELLHQRLLDLVFGNELGIANLNEVHVKKTSVHPEFFNPVRPEFVEGMSDAQARFVEGF